MELKRKVAMVAATLSVALGAGHLMQNGIGVKPGRIAIETAEATGPATETPKEITPLAAGLGGVSTPSAPTTETAAAPELPATAFSPPPDLPEEAASAPDLTVPPMPGQEGATTDLPVSPADMVNLPMPDAATSAEPVVPEMILSGDSTNCPVTLDVIASAQATLDLTLKAPCRASERVVIRHGGLAITGMTSLTGTLFTSLPGMEESGTVSVLFGDGAEFSAAESLPDLPLYRRFAVQWMSDDAFQINAFENGAVFGGAGHVSATNPQRSLPNVAMKGGYLSLLGDGSAPLPMLAEVYTFPLDTKASVDLTIEASVTEATCNRELLGEVLLSEAGVVAKTDLTMATPTCDAIGDVLVLNNPLTDLRLATAN